MFSELRVDITWDYAVIAQQILDSSKQKEFADDNFEFDTNGRNFSKKVENTVEKEKLLIWEKVVKQRPRYENIIKLLTLYRTKILDWSKFKAFAANKLNITS